jgi:hypothetical protein
LLDFKALVEKDIDLAHNTNLRSIMLPSMDWMFTLLPQITSPHVEYVSLTIHHMFTVSHLDEVDWSSMERLLTRPQWASLQQFKIRLFPYHTLPFTSEVRESVKHRMPILESRGVVDVCL